METRIILKMCEKCKLFENNFNCECEWKFKNYFNIFGRNNLIRSIFFSAHAGAPGVHQDSTRSAPGVRQECTRSAPGLHQECTRSAPGLHQECTRIAPGVHQECQRSAPGVRQECTRISYDAASLCVLHHFGLVRSS